MDSATGKLVRPGSVKCASVMFVADNGLSVVVFMTRHSSGRLVEVIVRGVLVLVLVGLLLLPLWFAYRGKSWGRWVIVGLQVLGLLYFERGLRRVQARGEFDVYLYWAQTLVELIATLLLFLPSSNRWFKLQRSASLLPPVIPTC